MLRCVVPRHAEDCQADAHFAASGHGWSAFRLQLLLLVLHDMALSCMICEQDLRPSCTHNQSLPLPFPLALGFSGGFLAPFLPAAAGAGGGGGGGGFKMILEPSSGKSGYSPVSGSLFSRNHALICKQYDILMNASTLNACALLYCAQASCKETMVTTA